MRDPEVVGVNSRELRAAVDNGMEDRAAMIAAAEILRENAGQLRKVADALDAAAADLVGPGGDTGERLMGAQLQATVALRGLAGGEQAIGAGLDVLLALLRRGLTF